MFYGFEMGHGSPVFRLTGRENFLWRMQGVLRMGLEMTVDLSES